MAKRTLREYQRSIRLNEEELNLVEGLVGYRGLWDFSEIVRAGLQVLSDQEHDEFAGRGVTGARRRETQPKKGGA